MPIDKDVRGGYGSIGNRPNAPRNPQTHNRQGTRYSGSLADFMKEANRPKANVSTLDKSIMRRAQGGQQVASPSDTVAAAGRVAAGPEAQKQYGSKNKAMRAFLDFVDQQSQITNARDTTNRRFDPRTGQVRNLSDVGIRSIFNKAAGVNPTTGMGIADSLQYNYEQTPANFRLGSALAGLLGSATVGPLAGLAAGNMYEQLNPLETEEGMNEYGFPVFDGGQIDQYRTTPTFDSRITEDDLFGPEVAPEQDLQPFEAVPVEVAALAAAGLGRLNSGSRARGASLLGRGTNLRAGLKGGVIGGLKGGSNARLGTTLNVRPGGAGAGINSSPIDFKNSKLMSNTKLKPFSTNAAGALANANQGMLSRFSPFLRGAGTLGLAAGAFQGGKAIGDYGMDATGTRDDVANLGAKFADTGFGQSIAQSLFGIGAGPDGLYTPNDYDQRLDLGYDPFDT